MPAKQYVRNDRRIRVGVAEGRLTIEERDDDPRSRLVWSGPLKAGVKDIVETSFLGPDAVIERLVAEIPLSLAGEDWEQILRPAAGGRVVVRQVQVRPSYGEQPLVLPVRVLHLTYGRPTVDEWVRLTLLHPDTDATVTATAAEPHALSTVRRLGWPVADIVHITEPVRYEPDQPDFAALERLIRVAQCRLLVLEPTDHLNRARLLSQAARIVDRGGPAVLVQAPDDGFAAFYADILHDKPLDAAVRRLSHPCLYAGRGREDALRVSTAGEQLFQLLRSGDLPPDGRTAAESFVMQWPGLAFADSERLGLRPMAAAVAGLRAGFPPIRPAGQPVQRQVNPALYEGDREIPANEHRPLRTGRTYDLCIRVGTEATGTVANPQPLLFERPLWDAADEGIWLDVGVTGIDWEVVGDAEQQLFVPKEGPAAPCWFAVRTSVDGTPVLRYTLFHRGHVVQSYRLAAATGESVDDRGLAEVLGLGLDDSAGYTWRARLEFSTVATIEQSLQRPPRSVSIVANEIAGRAVITFKTAGQFEVNEPDGDLGDLARQGRELLDRLTFAEGVYRMGDDDDDPNAGDSGAFPHDLEALATYGANLYDKLVPLRTRHELEHLRTLPDTVQIAGIFRNKPLPWALVYQGKYLPGEVEDDDGNLADHGVCTALVDGEDPGARTGLCGASARCLLHSDQVDLRRQRNQPPMLPETVACPGRLWGFRYRIETPPGQVPPNGTGSDAIVRIDASDGATAVLAVSPDLDVQERQSQELITLVRDRGWELLLPDRRATLRTALKRNNIALVHVLSKTGGATVPPELRYRQLRDEGWEVVQPGYLHDVIWSRHPLVLLNGCGTAGFSSEAVGAFIQAFVDDRQAAAVLGTEASVSDLLAAEFGDLFLTAFLKGATAGDALRAARQSLLRRRNPLGLSYTLFGMSELRLQDRRTRSSRTPDVPEK